MYVLSAKEEDPVLQKLLFSVPADGLSSKNLLLKHNLLWTAAEGSYRKFFFLLFAGLLQEHVLRFLMFSQENQLLTLCQILP